MPGINLPVLIGVLSSLNFISFAQVKFNEFDQKPLKISNNRLHLIKVVDLRINKNCITKVVETNPDSLTCIDFKDGLESVIFNYLSPPMTRDNFTLPVRIEIVDLSIYEHEIKNKRHRVTTVQLAVFHADNSLNEKIFQGIIQKDNLTDLNNTEYAEEIQDLLRLAILKINHDKEVKKYIEKVIPLHPYTINHRITFITSIGLDANNYAIQYYRYKINPVKDWVRPIGLALGFFATRDNHSRFSLAEESKIAFLSPGITLFKKLSNYWWLNLKNQIPLGIEKAVIGNETDKNFVFGVSFSQFIMLIPVEKYGASFGIGTYQRLLKSKVYPWDLGLIFDFGIKF